MTEKKTNGLKVIGASFGRCATASTYGQCVRLPFCRARPNPLTPTTEALNQLGFRTYHMFEVRTGHSTAILLLNNRLLACCRSLRTMRKDATTPNCGPSCTMARRRQQTLTQSLTATTPPSTFQPRRALCLFDPTPLVCLGCRSLVCSFVEEFLKRYPDAKVILTIRSVLASASLAVD